MDEVLYKAGSLLQEVRPDPDEMARVAAAVLTINQRARQAARDRLAPEDEPAAFQAEQLRGVGS